MKPAKIIAAFAALVLTALFLTFFSNDNIRFYGLVLDQNESPVPDITVHFNARSGFLSGSSGHQRTKSNINDR